MKHSIRYCLFAIYLALQTGSSQADSLIINGLYDCQRATNGRAYCKRVGAPASAKYVPVSEDFYSTYEVARSGRTTAPTEKSTLNVDNRVSIENTQINNVVITLKDQSTNIAGQILALESVLKNEEKIYESEESDKAFISETLSVIKERISDLRSRLDVKNGELSKYSSPIRPNDINTGVTARKASEFYPKIPYYIPGTSETGEFWVEPFVTDTGNLVFNFKFVDIDSAAVEKIRGSIEMTIQQLDLTQSALSKIAKNSKTAHEKGIRRKFDQRLVCFPEADCPPEGKKIDSKASTEILFSINADGSTNGRIQRNKGKFEEGYNISVKSAILLRAYINFVLKDAQKEFNAGSATDEDIRQIFK